MNAHLRLLLDDAVSSMSIFSRRSVNIYISMDDILDELLCELLCEIHYRENFIRQVISLPIIFHVCRIEFQMTLVESYG